LGNASSTAPDVAEADQRTTQLQHAYAPLAQSFRDLPPTAASWWFEITDWTVADLLRRTLVETAVHLWDAQNAVSDGQPLNDDVAALSLQDDRRLWIPRQAQNTPPPNQWIQLQTPDGPTTGWWHGPEPEDNPAAVVTSTGASQLCLSRWGRHDPQELDISGWPAALSDHQIFGFWFTNAGPEEARAQPDHRGQGRCVTILAMRRSGFARVLLSSGQHDRVGFGAGHLSINNARNSR
jgi:hypothetical protein